MSNPVHRTLTSSDEIEAYLHRTRMAILGALRDGPATASQVAARLGVHPANLTRHFRTLEHAGLIQLVEKRDTGRNLEKYYAATAATFDVAPESNNLRSPHKTALAFARSDLSAALSGLPDEEPRTVVAAVVAARIASADATRFEASLAALVESFSAADTADGETYHLNLSLYPAAPEPEGSRRIHIRRDAPG